MILLLVLSVLNSAGIDSLLQETPGNETVWMNYIESASGDTLESCLYLLENIPRLDRLEMTTEVLNDHILSSLVFSEQMPDSIFTQYLLWYRVSTEPVSCYRELLCSFWENLDISTPTEISGWIRENMTVSTRRFLGEMQTPGSVLSGRAGTPSELQVLEVSSMRALGFPARVVTGWFGGEQGEMESWIEIWEDGDWAPAVEPGHENIMLVVEESHGAYLTENYTETGTLVVIPPLWEEIEFLISLNIPVEGRFIPLDWLMPDTDNPDTLTMGSGDVLVTLAKRLPSGAVEVWNRFVVVTSGAEVLVDFSADPGL